MPGMPSRLHPRRKSCPGLSTTLARSWLAGCEQVLQSPFVSKNVELPTMNTSAAQPPESDPIIERLEDQLDWYDRKSLANQRAYKRIKVVEILAAETIPLLAAVGRPQISMVTGGLGVLIT